MIVIFLGGFSNKYGKWRGKVEPMTWSHCLVQFTVHFDEWFFFPLSVRVQDTMFFKILLPTCLYTDNGKGAFSAIWKHLLVSPKNWFYWISHKSSSIYINGFLLFVSLFLKLIVFHMKTLYIVLGTGFHLINKKGNFWNWEYIFTMTSGLCNRNHCFNKGIGIL